MICSAKSSRSWAFPWAPTDLRPDREIHAISPTGPAESKSLRFSLGERAKKIPTDKGWDFKLWRGGGSQNNVQAAWMLDSWNFQSLCYPESYPVKCNATTHFASRENRRQPRPASPGPQADRTRYLKPPAGVSQVTPRSHSDPRSMWLLRRSSIPQRLIQLRRPQQNILEPRPHLL